MSDRVRLIVSWLAWPVLLGGCLAATAWGYSIGKPVLTFNLTYFSLAGVLLLLEYLMPHERSWLASDGQTPANIAHTLLSKGTVQTLIVFSSVIGLAAYVTPMAEPGHGFWPRDWPLWAQVVIAVYLSEFGLYWAHRLAHEWPPLWRFHAIHHSVTKLWVVNTGRFHFVDSLKSIVPGMMILIPLGAPMEVITWLSAITAYIGILTHCNVEMRFGPLSWIFNTPGLHRWHHSRDLREGNKNYGENVVLWDILFGTWFNENRRPPADIGISEAMPPRFIDQVLWPFRRPQPAQSHAPEAAE
ncbi:MAG: sterol desaturase family protein [Micavibrio aeruginosavorus]|nr:sterol desaturase family protein [Micavibrio aeruginosavorus]